MANKLLESAFANLSTALIADACVRLQVRLRIAPSGMHPLVPEMRVAGRVLPSRHRGSVDVFLEAMRKALPWDVLVVGNDGRSDESCVGDLTVLEARRGAWRVWWCGATIGTPMSWCGWVFPYSAMGRIQLVPVASI